jgi:uncharacterized metal-binding protein YceD (DUF177 family)
LKVSLEDLRALPQQRLKIDFNESLPGSDAVKPVLGELVVSVSASGAQVMGRIQTLLKLVCHSCLRPFFQTLNLGLDERFVYEDYLSEGPKELRERELCKADFVEAIRYSGVIDISDIVYQAITLATPTYCSCGPDCPGPPWTKTDAAPGTLATTADHDVKPEESTVLDPRWKNLKTLFSNDDS